MNGVNRCHFIGNLGKDPEIRHLDNGTTVANFSIAVTESYKDRNSGQKVEQTEWVNIVLWRGLAEVAEKFLKKGDSVYIEGKLKTRSWEKDGVTRYATDVVADQMTMLGSQKKGDIQGAEEVNHSSQSQPAGKGDGANEMDDLPF